MKLPSTVRLSFFVAVALVAAALGDPCVESLAGAGVFGPGYADTNHLGVIPALIAGLTFVIGLLVVRGIEGWRTIRAERSARLALAASLESARGVPLPELALVVPLQLAAVFGMECLEAVMVHRPLPSGLSWLGAPPLVSLAIHVLVGMACLWTLRRIVRTLLGGLAACIRVAAAIVVRRHAPASAPSAADAGRERVFVLRAQAPHCGQVGERAPPAFLLSPIS
ncbi:MAG: hypothetical protein ACREM2_03775 [Vulcanimicrobiaceae bacterium]